MIRAPTATTTPRVRWSLNSKICWTISAQVYGNVFGDLQWVKYACVRGFSSACYIDGVIGLTLGELNTSLLKWKYRQINRLNSWYIYVTENIDTETDICHPLHLFYFGSFFGINQQLYVNTIRFWGPKSHNQRFFHHFPNSEFDWTEWNYFSSFKLKYWSAIQ